MFDRSLGRFVRTVRIDDGKVVEVDRTVDASLLALPLLGVFEPDDPMVVSTVKAVEELLNAPRVVGGVDPRSTEKAIQLYGKVNPHLQPTDATTAEFVKLAENTYRDLNIALANLLALMARLGLVMFINIPQGLLK